MINDLKIGRNHTTQTAYSAAERMPAGTANILARKPDPTLKNVSFRIV